MALDPCGLAACSNPPVVPSGPLGVSLDPPAVPVPSGPLVSLGFPRVPSGPFGVPPDPDPPACVPVPLVLVSRASYYIIPKIYF